MEHLTDSDIVRKLKQIDALQAKLSDIISSIAQSDHPHNEAISEELYQQCWFPASAQHVAVDYLNPKKWKLREIELDSGEAILGSIVRKSH